jgi:signal transduction histidine kinase
LADFVIEDCEGKLPAESFKHLHAIKQRIFRMQRLLEDLLEYSKVGKDESNIKTFNSQTVIQSAMELSEIPPTINVEFTGDDYEVETWITPLETCLRNLIGNSVKHRDVKSGRIEIHCEQFDDFITFSVADDGRGIPSEHHERIFRMFEALKRRDEVEGSGMGLAVVKKTVEIYGGSITVESPNKWSGSTFHLRWPNSIQVPA